MSTYAKTVFESLLQATQVDRALRQRAQIVTREVGDITASEWLLLGIVAKGPRSGMTMTALSQTLSVSRPQVTALIDGLLLKRLVRQKKSEQDGRSKTVTVTQRGTDTLKRVEKALKTSFEELTKAIPGTHLQIYEQVQREIIRKA
jgi:DNA-binding MarR family transcriptional regulator